MEGASDPLQSIPVLEGPTPTSLPYALPLYQCRSTCPQLAYHKTVAGPLPQSLQAIPLSPKPTSRLPWYLASWQLEVAPIGQPVASLHLPAKGVQIKCRTREGPALPGDELRVDGRWVEP